MLRCYETSLCAKSGPEQMQQCARTKLRLLDHLIGAGEQLWQLVAFAVPVLMTRSSSIARNGTHPVSVAA